MRWFDVAQLAVADVQEGGNIAAQVEQRMQLNGRFGRAKWSPRKHRQTQIDGTGIQRINRLAYVVELGCLGAQAGFDIAQAFSISKLSEGHTQILVETGEALHLVLAAIARNATTKRRQRQMLRQLRANTSLPKFIDAPCE